MLWLTVFSACLAAVILGGLFLAVAIAWFLGRAKRTTSIQLPGLSDYPVDADGNLKGMEPAPAPAPDTPDNQTYSLRL